MELGNWVLVASSGRYEDQDSMIYDSLLQGGSTACMFLSRVFSASAIIVRCGWDRDRNFLDLIA